ncbi:MAG: PepSY-like domain-containing protein [Bacteroidia bacterium]
MKKEIMLLIGVAFLCVTSHAQKITADKVPAEVTSAFKAKFPEVKDVDWEMEKANEFEAAFKVSGADQTASFNADGKWMETETEIKVSELPAVVKQSIEKQFPGFKMEEASKVDNAEKGLCYEAEIEKGKETYEVLLNSKGELLSKNVEKEEEDKD